MTDLGKYKTADLVWESKHRFKLVIRLKVIEITIGISYLFIV